MKTGLGRAAWVTVARAPGSVGSRRRAGAAATPPSVTLPVVAEASAGARCADAAVPGEEGGRRPGGGPPLSVVWHAIPPDPAAALQASCHCDAVPLMGKLRLGKLGFLA